MQMWPRKEQPCPVTTRLKTDKLWAAIKRVQKGGHVVRAEVGSTLTSVWCSAVCVEDFFTQRLIGFCSTYISTLPMTNDMFLLRTSCSGSLECGPDPASLCWSHTRSQHSFFQIFLQIFLLLEPLCDLSVSVPAANRGRGPAHHSFTSVVPRSRWPKDPLLTGKKEEHQLAPKQRRATGRPRRWHPCWFQRGNMFSFCFKHEPDDCSYLLCTFAAHYRGIDSSVSSFAAHRCVWRVHTISCRAHCVLCDESSSLGRGD